MGIEALRRGGRTCSPPAGTSPRVEDVELLAPFKFYRDEPRTLELRALRARRRRRHARGRLPARRAPHAARRRRAGDRALHRPRPARPRGARATAPARRPASARGEPSSSHDAVYRVYFHGPAYQVLDRAWREQRPRPSARSRRDLPPNHDAGRARRRDRPAADRALLPDRRRAASSARPAGMALPTHVDRVVRFAGADEPGRLFAVVSTARGRRRRRRRGRRRDRPRAGAARGLPHDRAARRRSTRTRSRRSARRCEGEPT